MTWRIWAQEWQSGELSDTSKFFTFKMPSAKILLGIRTWIVVYNDPTFTDLNAKLYSDEIIGGLHTPKALIASSTKSITKAEVLTLDNGVREIPFTFDYIPLNADTFYNLVINGAGYSYSAGSHLAWRVSYPNPVYTDGITVVPESLSKMPFFVSSIIAGDF